jgi:hypothetical protein
MSRSTQTVPSRPRTGTAAPRVRPPDRKKNADENEWDGEAEWQSCGVVEIARPKTEDEAEGAVNERVNVAANACERTCDGGEAADQRRPPPETEERNRDLNEEEARDRV